MKEEKNKECSFEGCSRDVYSKSNQCVLHCDKEGDSDFLRDITPIFINELIEYIIEKVCESTNLLEKYSKESFVYYFKGAKQHVSGITSSTVNRPVIFNNIKFPDRIKPDNDNYEVYITFDYVEVLNKLGSIEFFQCDFHSNELNVKGPSIHFINCSFLNAWKVSQYKLLDERESIFKSCDFLKDVYIKEKKLSGYSVPLFKNCIFKELLRFENIAFAKEVFVGERNFAELNRLEIDSCEFRGRFILNQMKNKIPEIDIISSVFKSKFELKNNEVGLLKIEDTNFINIVDFFDTNFDEVHFEKCIIEDFIGFEKCEFGFKENSADCEKSKFVYTTFKNIPNFRNTKFHSGLDIETANFMKSPNFLKTEIEPKNTNRETFRIIKNSFDSVGNNIEANRFFALEMSKYKEELEKNKKGNRHKLFIFNWNKWLSNFGQSYLKPFGWLLLTMVVFSVLICGKKNNWIYVFSENSNESLSNIIEEINSFAESFLPFKKFLVSGMELLSLLFYIIFLILSWQIIVAVKRHTKR